MYSRQMLNEIGDRQKGFESASGLVRLIPGLPFIIRLDGRAFKSFTRRANKPFDRDLSDIMDETTAALVQEFNADVGYTQSDEISLGFKNDDPYGVMPMNGRRDKLLSLVAGYASAAFMKNLLNSPFAKRASNKIPSFDARVSQLPTLELAGEHFRWREMDSVMNSINALASSVFQESKLHGLNADDRLELLAFNEVSWMDLGTRNQRGAYYQRCRLNRELTPSEREKIPEKHRPAVGTQVFRSVVLDLELPACDDILNYEEVLFYGAEPRLKSDVLLELTEALGVGTAPITAPAEKPTAPTPLPQGLPVIGSVEEYQTMLSQRVVPAPTPYVAPVFEEVQDSWASSLNLHT